MSKRCARCDKTVYPIEELKCLDKVWHKGCFKCQECGMTLSMKTYKGFNKLPYCEAHIPKAKATAVAETPEMKRLAENTKIQSNVQYHADFEKNKAKFTPVADDPETRRIKQNTKIISNVSYHGDLEKKAVMEKKRTDPTTGEEIQGQGPAGILSHDDYQYNPVAQNLPQQPSHGISHSQPMPQAHNAHAISQQHSYQGNASPGIRSYSSALPANNHSNPQQPYYPQQQQQQAAPPHHHYTSSNNHSYDQHHQQQQQQLPYYHKDPPTVNNTVVTTPSYQPQQQQQLHHHHHHHPLHSVAQQNVYQDANHNSPYSAARNSSQTLIYSSQTGPVKHQPPNRVGSIADYDPLNDQYGSIAQQKRNQPQGIHRQEPYQNQRMNVYAESNQNYAQSASNNQIARQSQQKHHKVSAPPTHLGRCYRAIYDYEAADTDEVSFRDGDLLTNCTSIDEGWMMGTVQRTGQMGMLPANYVERAS